ncbi:hypothetical protein MLD38_002264 [Melastoma candidum]|uniref:Uncharacterized protein n=1 Tax=Melastoma candidum TaxID=119954 RepID=A0ACB9SFV1_9MYRT|nr:hypothetical protein MLD38_002264 [Melastoma candidum]
MASAGTGRSVERRLADYHPSVWGDYFLKYDSNACSEIEIGSSDEAIRMAVEEVKAKLTGKADEVSEILELIDRVQRLGIARHFENEIDKKLAELHDVYPQFINSRNNGNEKLHVVALYFRLLRQQGYNISCEVFDKFRHTNGKFTYTEALQKWDLNAIEGLPGYMQLHYRALLSIYREAEMELARKGSLYRLPYAIQSMKDQAAGFLAEAKWFFQKYKPTLDEYIIIAYRTTAYAMLVTNSFVGMGDAVTEEGFKWASGNPKMLKASTVVCRLMDDIVSRKFEQKRGHVASAVECYIKQYGGTEVEAEEALNKMVFDAWKDINKASLMPFEVAVPILTRVLNFTRVIDVLYKDGDNYTHSSTLTKRIIGYLLVDPLQI